MTPCGTQINRNTWCGQTEDDYNGDVLVILCPECEAEEERMNRLDFEMPEIIAQQWAEVTR